MSKTPHPQGLSIVTLELYIGIVSKSLVHQDEKMIVGVDENEKVLFCTIRGWEFIISYI